jgi:hypothetical protein
MPSVLEIEETLTEIRELPTYESPHQAPERSFLSKIAAALKGIVVRSERSTEFGECRPAYEMPVDTLARKHPYEYARALVG